MLKRFVFLSFFVVLPAVAVTKNIDKKLKHQLAQDCASKFFTQTSSLIGTFNYNTAAKFRHQGTMAMGKQLFSYNLYGISETDNTKTYKLFIYNSPKQQNIALVGCVSFSVQANDLYVNIHGKTLAIAKELRGTGFGKGLLLWVIKIFKYLGSNKRGVIVKIEAKPIKFLSGESEKELIPSNILINYYKGFGFISDTKKPENMSMYIDSNGKILSIAELKGNV